MQITIFGVPVCKDTLKFFNLKFTEEETSINDNSDSSNACITTEQSELSGKFFDAFSVFFHEEYEVNILLFKKH